MVYVAAQARQMLLSHRACGEFDLVIKDFSRIAAQPEVMSCMDTEDNVNDGSPPHGLKTITMEPTDLSNLETKEHLEEAIGMHDNTQAYVATVRDIGQVPTKYQHKEMAGHPKGARS